MWGIVPAAGAGSRIQPLAFSKELLPVGSRIEDAAERSRAVSEYVVERMLIGGATRICFVLSRGKADILEYYGASSGTADLAYVVQPSPSGLCDAVFRALPLIHSDDSVIVGLPDTIWFPADGYRWLPEGVLSFLCFPVEHPEYFDAVVADDQGRVAEIQVKRLDASTNWVWGGFRMTGAILRDLHDLWNRRGRRDDYMGTLVNGYLQEGGEAFAARAGTDYVDVGTVHGYREAIRLLSARRDEGALGATREEAR